MRNKKVGVINRKNNSIWYEYLYENIRYGNENARTTDIEEAPYQAYAHGFVVQLADVCNE